MPDGQRSCSMCYGDPYHGSDGYYLAWLEEQDQRAAEQAALEEQQHRDEERRATMIEISKSPTADTRTCDFKAVTKEQLYASSEQHIEDVRAGLEFFRERLAIAAREHDPDKLTDIEGFHRDFVHGFDEEHQTWWTQHRQLNRHHLNMPDGVREDVNLVDVLDYITDCVMAGMARSGSLRPVTIEPDVLMRAFENTVALLKDQVVVVDA